MRKIITFILFDHLLIALALWLVILFRGNDLFLTLQRIYDWLLVFLGWHLILALAFDKYLLRSSNQLRHIWYGILKTNAAFLGLASIGVVLFSMGSFPRVLLFGTAALVTAFELVVWSILHLFWKTKAKFFDQPIFEADTFKTPPDKTTASLVDPSQQVVYRVKTNPNISVRGKILHEVIVEELGEQAYQYISSHVPLLLSTMVVATNKRINILSLPGRELKYLVNLHHVNNHRFVNKFFETVNIKLPTGGIYVGVAETKEIRKKRFLRRYSVVLGYFLYAFDYLWTRVAPKLPGFKTIYFTITAGKKRVMSRAEILGRLYSCGFEVVDEAQVDKLYYFVVRKVSDPVFDLNPTYGPLIRLNRIGKDGKTIGVYKMRTMHPYAEYLQAYVHQKYSLQQGGKFKNDFRISTLGRIMRKLWIDELPMLMNCFRGEIKLVGVRPLSEHYFKLYSNELQQRRIRHKPGLVPPFYADMPKTFKEIMASEQRYLDAYEKNPFITDFRYFFMAFYNIVFCNARSC